MPRATSPSLRPTTVARRYLVHADGEGGSGGLAGESGGLVTVKSTEGKVSTSGRAISAFGQPGSNSDGGSIVVEAFNNADLDAAIFDSGGRDHRGIIFVRSFNGQVTGNSPGLLDTCGLTRGPRPAARTTPASPFPLSAPTSSPSRAAGRRETGSHTRHDGPNAFTNPGDACGGAPILPSYVTLPECACQDEPPPECKWCTKGAVYQPGSGRTRAAEAAPGSVLHGAGHPRSPAELAAHGGGADPRQPAGRRPARYGFDPGSRGCM